MIPKRDTAPTPSEQAHGCYSVEYEAPNDSPPIIYGNDYSETETPEGSAVSVVVLVSALVTIALIAWGLA